MDPVEPEDLTFGGLIDSEEIAANEALMTEPMEMYLLGSDGQVVASASKYAGQSITFSNMPSTTLTEMVLDTPDGRVFVDLTTGTRRTVHDCDTPDEDLFDGIHWTCPDCGREWQVQVERWWGEVDE